MFSRQNGKWYFVIGGLATLAIVAAVVLSAIPAAAARPSQAGESGFPKTITVVGSGSASAAPDVATAQIGVDTQAASPEAANEAIQIHGAYGYSDEYDVERYLRNSRGAVIYEGTSEIHQLMQAGYALGYRTDGELRCELPAYDEKAWRS